MIYIPDRRSGIYISMLPRKGGAPAPWWDGTHALTLGRNLMDQMMRVPEGQRVILKTPMCRPPGLVPSAQWHTGFPYRQAALIGGINGFRYANPGVAVDLFIGCRVDDPYSCSMTNAVPP